MKLTPAQVERTLTQFKGEVIPDHHPVVPQLNGVFGEHTFFLDSHGLNILEPAEASAAGGPSAKGGEFAHRSGRKTKGLGGHDTQTPPECVLGVSTHRI